MFQTSKPQVKEKEKAVKGFSEVVSRDLTEREQIEIQRQSDFRLAKDLFGFFFHFFYFQILIAYFLF